MKKQRTERGGFTMAELLVVIGIIAILASLLLPVIGKVQNESRRKADMATLQQLKTALGTYELDHQDFPPSRLAMIGLAGANNTNQGIEVVVACLSSEKKGARYFEFPDDRLDNTDNDRSKLPLSKLTGSYIQANDLFEIIDMFGNPFVYLHHRDYAKPGTAASYLGEDLASRTLVPQRSEKTKEWHGAGMFQMWGFGPDGVNENGGGDDVVSW